VGSNPTRSANKALENTGFQGLFLYPKVKSKMFSFDEMQEMQE